MSNPEWAPTADSVSQHTLQDEQGTAPPATSKDAEVAIRFLERFPAADKMRTVYLRAMIRGIIPLAIAIFAFFSIYWGAVWKSPVHTLPGWIIDFDGGIVGQTVSKALHNMDSGPGGVCWSVVPASAFPSGCVIAQLDTVWESFALQAAQKVLSAPADIANVLSNAAQLVTKPMGYTMNNLRPFDVPVASATTFVGLSDLIILSFLVVVISHGERAAAGMEERLTLGSLVIVRISTSVVAYFFLALFYTLLSRAFQLPLDRRFGSAGFVIFWMLNWIGMLSCGLVLDAMITLITLPFLPVFLFLWIFSNVAVCNFPIPVLPSMFRYGYVFPAYNISRAVRTIVFRTKNDLALNFGILLGWVILLCITIPLVQLAVLRRRRSVIRDSQSTRFRCA
ncbi:hypothetical protein B0H14DRAFT_3774374 [Mycena olivaceomarginata]|nr:hypothetical protein B0H14DRAFT_3774374 [Mycena olivaceomarginata]